MEARSHVELDFLCLQNHNDSSDSSHPRLHRRRSFSGISKINPEIVKSVIASAADHTFKSLSRLPPPPHSILYHDLPVFKSHPNFTGASEPGTSPLTIFYKGTVSIFDMPNDKAEEIIKFAFGKGCSPSKTDAELEADVSSFHTQNDGDLPIKRKKSLQRFFEKRKQRLIAVSPYPNPTHHVGPILHQKTSV